jgi:hypothetical protein
MDHVISPKLNRKRQHSFLIDGHAIELWAVKVLLGSHHGGITYFGETRSRDVAQFDTEAAVRYLSDAPMPWPLGFYFFSEWGDDSVLRMNLTGVHDQILSIKLRLQSFPFDCVVSTPNGTAEFEALRSRRRPPIIEVATEDFSSVIYFAWGGMQVGDTIFRESGWILRTPGA